MTHDSLAFGQLSIINLTTIISSLFASSLAILVIIMSTCILRYRILWSRAMLFMALGNFNESISKVAGPFTVAAGSTSLPCQLQAALLIAAQLASNIWAHYMAMVFYLVLIRAWTVQDAVRKMDRIYMVLGVVVPTLVAVPWFFVRIEGRGPVYVENVTWCGISPAYPWVQAGISYIPMALIGAFNLCMFSYIGYRMYRMHQKVGTMSSASSGVRRLSNFVVAVSVYMLIFLVSWVPGLVYLVDRTQSGGHDKFVYLLVRTASAPLRGLLTLFLYVLFSRAHNRRQLEEHDDVLSVASQLSLSIKSEYQPPEHAGGGYSMGIASSPILGCYLDDAASLHGTPDYKRRHGMDLDISRPAVPVEGPTTAFEWLRRSSEEALQQREQQRRQHHLSNVKEETL